MARYELTPRARLGVRDILDYVDREFGPRLAEDVLDRLVSAFERLAEDPGIGRAREDITNDESVRFWSVAPTLIAYRVGADAVEILIVERGERDWDVCLPRTPEQPRASATHSP